MTLAEFLLARIAEDEACARDGLEDYADMDPQERADFFAADLDAGAPWATDQRTLRECEAKRRIVEEHQGVSVSPDDGSEFVSSWDDYTTCKTCRGQYPEDWPCPTLRILAAVYSDHPDYDPDWAV